MKVLFIDDQAESVQTAMNELAQAGHECTHGVFGSLDENLINFVPDVVSLDLMNGAADNQGEAGSQLCNKIWDNHCCPVIVYSANTDLFDHPNSRNTHFFRKIKKGAGSEELIISAIANWRPAIDALTVVRNEMNDVLKHNFRESVPHAMRLQDQTTAVLSRIVRRRIAAHLDECSYEDRPFNAWEEYIVPSIGDSLLLGDVIKKSAENNNDPSVFRLILTPNCDLARHKKGDGTWSGPKVKEVLCAVCESAGSFFEQDTHGYFNPTAAKNAKDKKKQTMAFKSLVLGNGFCREFLPLPSLKDVIPPMIANLKRLELIPCVSIAPNSSLPGDCSWVRVASIDSPFREQIAWGYLSTACRVGVPDRDFSNWVKEYYQ